MALVLGNKSLGNLRKTLGPLVSQANISNQRKYQCKKDTTHIKELAIIGLVNRKIACIRARRMAVRMFGSQKILTEKCLFQTYYLLFMTNNIFLPSYVASSVFPISCLRLLLLYNMSSEVSTREKKLLLNHPRSQCIPRPSLDPWGWLGPGVWSQWDILAFASTRTTFHCTQ